jgi:hypothetical protein
MKDLCSKDFFIASFDFLFLHIRDHSNFCIMYAIIKTEKKTKSHVCIGSIFGMDVGGTLSKLLYFENKPQSQKRSISDITDSQPISTPSGVGLGRSAGARSKSSMSTNTEFRTRSQMGLMMKSKSLQANTF